MACYHPNIYWENASGDHCITGYTEDYNPPPKLARHPITRRMTVPCGQCIGCRVQRSKNWAIRLCLETKYHEDNWFLTLTYDEEHLPRDLHGPIANIKCDGYGEVYEENWYSQGYAKVKDLQDFWKRLRRHYEYAHGITGIKYYVGAEYGEKTNRPHYHAIVYGLPLYGDMEFWDYNELHQPTWTNEELNQLWGNGRVLIGQVTWESAAYCARYVTKKITGQGAADHYDSLGMTPEFSCMSQGIGKRYLEEHADEIYNTDEIIISNMKGKVKHSKPPRYFDYLYDLIDHEHLENLKRERRKNAEEREKLLDQQSTKTRMERLETEEAVFKARMAKYRRDKV